MIDLLFCSALLLSPPQDDVADVPSMELQAASDADKKYFLIGPLKEAKPPGKGWGLILVLPGGDGSAEFNPFVRRIYKNAVPEGFLMAQLVAKEWSPGQFNRIVWPTEKGRVKDMKFTTEEFADAVIDEISKRHTVDPARLYTLSWSSGGPAAYALALRKKTAVRGSLVAMSVFPILGLDVTAAKGHAFYLYHSKDDKVCPYLHVEVARKKLAEQEARVESATYDGGHGWRGPIYKDLRAGFEWLEKNRADAPGK